MTEKHANLELWKSAPLAEINHPHPKNPRVIPDADSEEVRTLDASLEHDYFDPLIWNKRNRMWVSGHVRAWRMTALGFTHADVVVVDYDEETHLARMLAANAHSGKNDEDKLDALLASLRDASVDPVLALLSALPRAPPPPAGDADAEPDTDRAAELNKIWQVETGQVWQIGPHRLMCGDSTSRQDVQRLMNGEMAKLVVTDPPYGVDYQGGTTKRKKLSGDGNADLYGPILKLAFEFSDEKCAVYLWHSDSKSAAVSAAVSAAGYERRVTIIWNKNLAQFGALGAQYKTKHEPCLYLYKKGNSPRWFGPTNEVTVWDEDRNQVNEHHPTEKPVSVMLRPVRNSSEAGDVVLDLFLGSGTTMLAAQNLHRICYGMEISPDYCAVILDRMHRAFPDLEIKRVA